MYAYTTISVSPIVSPNQIGVFFENLKFYFMIPVYGNIAVYII